MMELGDGETSNATVPSFLEPYPVLKRYSTVNQWTFPCGLALQTGPQDKTYTEEVMPKSFLALNWGKHLLFQIVHVCRGSVLESGQESLGCVVSVLCANSVWFRTKILCTSDDHRTSICLWKLGCVL